MVQLGPDFDLAQRLKRLEDRMARLENNPYGQAFSSTQSDGSIGMQIYQNPNNGATALTYFQGPASTLDANGHHPTLMYIGQLYQDGQPVGSGLLLYYASGLVQMAAMSADQGVQLMDLKGNQTFGPDKTASEGLARPWLTLPLPQATYPTSYPNTTATTWTEVARANFTAKQPRVWCYGILTADASTTAQMRVDVVNAGGTAVSSQVYTASNNAYTYMDETFTGSLPSGFFGNEYGLSVKVQVTAGTGKGYAQIIGAEGRQS